MKRTRATDNPSFNGLKALRAFPVLAWLILAGTSVLTFVAWRVATRQQQNKVAERLSARAAQLESAIVGRMGDYEAIMMGALGFVLTQSDGKIPPRRSWEQYFSAIDLKGRYPGIQGLGISQVVPPADLEGFVARTRRDGYPNFEIRPPERRTFYTAITHLEPQDARNQRAIGYDMYSEAVLRKAMSEAIDSGKPALSGRVTLVQEIDSQVQPGFLLYIPIYRTPEPANDVEERRRSIRGWVYAPFRAGDFMRGILGADSQDLNIALHDTEDSGQETELFKNKEVGPAASETGYIEQRRLRVRNRTWRLTITPRPQFISATESFQSLSIAVAGGAINLFLFLMIGRLVGERRLGWQLARRLSKKNRRLSAQRDLVLKGIGIGSWHWNPLSNELKWDESMFRLYEREFNSKDNHYSLWENSLTSGAKQRAVAELDLALRGQKDFDTSFEIVTGNGNTKFIGARAVVFRDKYGKPVLMSGINWDRTREVQAERLSHFYKRAIDSSAIVALTDSKGKITYVNDMFCSISGYSREELIGQDHRILNSGQMSKEFFSKMWSTIKSGETWSGLICNRAKDGSLYWVDTTISPLLNDEGAIEQYIAVRKNVTLEINQKKELEVARINAEKAVAAKSEFLAVMSHEIRTPLNGILGVSALLLDSKLNSDQQELARTISNSGQTLLAIINDILDFSKIEAGKLELESVEFELEAFLLELVRPYQHLASHKGLALNIKVPKAQRAVFGDAGRIGQIVNNLMSNAFKFTQRGTVDFSLSMTLGADLARVRIVIADTGIGISEDAKPRLFDPFTQAEQSTSRKFGGTGLGLSISKLLVGRMGGAIGFESELGVGTSFFVDLSLKLGREIEVAKKGGSETRPQSQPKLVGRVLVAEDNQTNQLVIGRMLETLGIKCHFAANGTEVLEALSRDRFDLILMDCQMPEMDGYTATQIIRSHPDPSSRIPIIAVTANAIQGEEQKCLAAGMNAFLTKPIERTQLRLMLSIFLEEQESMGNDLIIDMKCLAQFDELQMEGYPDILIETIDSFLTTSPTRVKGIREAAAAANWSMVGAEAHALKSSSRTLGAMALGALCESLEINSKGSNDEGGLLSLVSQLAEAHRNACEALIKIKRDRENKQSKGAA